MALVKYRTCQQPRSSAEEALFAFIEQRIQEEELKKIGIQILLASGQTDKAIELYNELIDLYLHDKHVKRATKQDMVNKLKEINKQFNAPIKVRSPGEGSAEEIEKLKDQLFQSKKQIKF